MKIYHKKYSNANVIRVYQKFMSRDKLTNENSHKYFKVILPMIQNIFTHKILMMLKWSKFSIHQNFVIILFIRFVSISTWVFTFARGFYYCLEFSSFIINFPRYSHSFDSILIINVKMHFCPLTSWRTGDRNSENTRKCTCEFQRAPKWTDKRFAMCEKGFSSLDFDLFSGDSGNSVLEWGRSKFSKREASSERSSNERAKWKLSV